MQNFSQYPQFVTYYIPIWFGPAFYNRQRPFVTTFQCPPSYIEYGVSNCSNENYITSTQAQKQEEKSYQNKRKIERNIIDGQKKNIQANQNQQSKSQQVKQLDNKAEKEFFNIKRPLTYETERSFYLKQRIKVNLRFDKRILRKRILQNSKIAIKCKLRPSKINIQKEKKKKQQKSSEKIIKQHKIQKNRNKKDNLNSSFSLAQIPVLISGFREINQFILKKLQNLRSRRIGNK